VSKIWHDFYPSGVPQSLKFDETLLPEALRRTARNFPDRPALVFRSTVITFRELEELVSKFAAALKSLGVEKGTRVSLILPNLVQTVVAMYATLRVGGTVVLHNPRSGDPALKHQFDDADPDVLVCLDLLVPRVLNIRKQTKVKKVISCHIRDYLPFLEKQLFPMVKRQMHLNTPSEADVHEFTDLLNSHRAASGGAPLIGEDTAFILYTSATTGMSKGVELTHNNVSFNVQQVRAWFPSFRDGGEVVVGCLPFFHVFGLTCALNIGIFYGYTNVVVTLPEPKPILEAIHENKATFVPALPNFYSTVANDPGVRKYNLGSLKGCFSGGAPLPHQTVRTFAKITGSQICEGYGLTETSPATHINPYGGITKTGTIGLPLPSTDAKIVDVNDYTKDITKSGLPGELCVRGPQVMKGYVNLPRETENALRDGWLLTGDIATMDGQGYFTIIDRKKDMIVSDGEPVYPREVEEVLFSHPSVVDAGAIGIPNPESGEKVMAFVVLRKGEKAAAEDIIAHCKKNLGPKQIPTAVEFMAELPRSPVGKTQRKELKRLYLLKSSSSRYNKAT
jgi:long-chain acyl-CoA synthetase